MSLKFKRHGPLLITLALVALTLIVTVGHQPIVTYSIQDTFELDLVAYSYHSAVAMFNNTIIHNIQILIS